MIVAGSASPLLLSSAGGYNLTKSLRFRSSASAYLNRTFGTPTSRRIFTFSIWTKRGELVSNDFIFGRGTGPESYLQWSTDNTLEFYDYTGSSYSFRLVTTQVFRDPSAWYHIIVAVDTTQATAANRIKIYVNGVQVTAFSTATYPSQNFDSNLNTNATVYIGRSEFASNYIDGYMTEINFIDGQALTPSSFGQTSSTTNVWQPIKYTGTYGTNGFYLPFTDVATTSGSNAGLGKDFSGNGNYWTTNNISVTTGTTYDSMSDVPTLTSATVANYAVLNPLNPSGGTYSDGNLKWVSATTDGRFALSTFDITSSGKWYCEVTIGTKSGTYWTVGAFGSPITFNPRMQYRSDGATQVNGSAGSTWASYTTGDVIGMAFDASTNQITFYKNNTSQGTLTASTTGVSYYFGCGSDSSGSTSTYTINFGQQPFAYTPPTGFKALNTFNLPTPTIGATASSQAGKYFNAVTYTGAGAGQTISGVGFQPDFVWMKCRDTAGTNNILQNAVVGATKGLESNTTAAEFTDSSTITAFTSDGFTAGGNLQTNQSSKTYVAWNWRASNTTAVTNTAGSITSTVSANTTAGFSIVTYTGTGSNATVGHGLGVAPSWVIVKRRSNTGNWYVYSISTGNTNRLRLDETSASTAESAAWNNTSPTSTVFSIGTSVDVNASGNTFVAYCFAQIAGYSAFGSYTGNGSADGTFVFTGFRPRFLLVKRTDGIQNWTIYDSARDTYNVEQNLLAPNTSGAEAVYAIYDFLSNGFKIRNTDNAFNASGGTYIYMAFAESPFKYANAR